MNYITTIEAAVRAGVTMATIENWCKTYSIGTKVGGRWRVDPGKLDRMLRGELNEKDNREVG